MKTSFEFIADLSEARKAYNSILVMREKGMDEKITAGELRERGFGQIIDSKISDSAWVRKGSIIFENLKDEPAAVTATIRFTEKFQEV